MEENYVPFSNYFCLSFALKLFLNYFENLKPNDKQFQRRFCVSEHFPSGILTKILQRSFLFMISWNIRKSPTAARCRISKISLGDKILLPVLVHPTILLFIFIIIILWTPICPQIKAPCAVYRRHREFAGLPYSMVSRQTLYGPYLKYSDEKFSNKK